MDDVKMNSSLGWLLLGAMVGMMLTAFLLALWHLPMWASGAAFVTSLVAFALLQVIRPDRI